MKRLQEIRQCVRAQNYRITAHAQEEADNDNLDKADIENILLRGKITRKFAHDLRGTRYVVTGETEAKRTVSVVCRFLETGKLSIITVYERKEQR